MDNTCLIWRRLQQAPCPMPVPTSPTVHLTRHATDRLTDRLPDLVTVAEVVAAVNDRSLPEGRAYVTVKHIEYVEVRDPDVHPDGVARGDSIVAVVDSEGSDRKVVTVMLRKSWSQSAEYDSRKQ